MMSSELKRERPVRQIKKPAVLVSDLDLVLEYGDSSDDSDFNVENLNENSDDDSFNSDDEDGGDNDQENDDSDGSGLEDYETKIVAQESGNALIERAKAQGSKLDLRSTPICSVCLGSRSDHENEIVECDRCGVSVHECCYGVNDSASISSTDSLAPTEPWFCEPCKEGVMQPYCELCPNSGGIFKATDVGRWVHLVCALYVPAIAFGEVERLASVTLFEMPYNKWGSKPCSLCSDERLSRCGVTVGCDAGMCKQFFHVTCGQKEGLLSEAWSEEVDQADPFYAHCKLHTDKQIMHRRRTNYIILSVRQQQRCMQLDAELQSPTEATQRILRKLAKKQTKYKLLRQNAVPPWVPTQKMPRPLTSSSTACRALWRKAELMDIDVLACESKQTRDAILRDIVNKWHIPPAFSVEFTAYFLDRNSRIPVLKQKLQSLLDRNAELSKDFESLEQRYNTTKMSKDEKDKAREDAKKTMELYHSVVKKLDPAKRLPSIQDMLTPRPLGSPMIGQSSPRMVPTAAALKAGVGYPLKGAYKGRVQTEPRTPQPATPQPTEPVVSCNECGICRGVKDQHLLTRCDACQLYYHLGCLTPPLTRMPKKTKLQGWECSECDKESSPVEEPVSGRRRPLHKSPPCLPDAFYPKDKDRVDKTGLKRKHHKTNKKKKKVKREEDMIKEAIANVPHIKIKITAIPSGDGLTSGTFLASSIEDASTPSRPTKTSNGVVAKVETPAIKSEPTDSKLTAEIPIGPVKCDTCNSDGDNKNLVRCDECLRRYHFGCLDPPLKKTPKVRGYSWYCAECDTSDADKK